MDTFLLTNNNNKGGSVKIAITPCQPKTLTHLPKRPPVDIAFSDLTYTVSEGKKARQKTILKSVSGRLRSGELTAIMGPSGAGKSTLLNILTGYKTYGMEGSITINGFERNLSQFRKLSCYIMQDNQLHGNLAVAEAMNVATSLKLNSDLSKKAKEEVIQEILETLGLQDHKKTLTSNLSGGQKKRLSIALELVNNPPIMFFDEPTSGLDSSSCFQCVSLLKSLSRGGRTIICTIHQPSARLFEMFDHLYTLAEGQCVYQGSIQQLVPFLGILGLHCPSYHNPASYLIEVACGEFGDNVKKLVTAIQNGKCDVQNNKPFPQNIELENLNNSTIKSQKDDGILHFEKPTSCDLEKKAVNLSHHNKVGDEISNLLSSAQKANNWSSGSTGDPHTEIVEKSNGKNISKDIKLIMDSSRTKENGKILKDKKEKIKQEKQSAKDGQCLLNEKNGMKGRYPISELRQTWIVLKRALLFSRRDWTLMYLRLFAHILVGILIGALYYNIGNDGAKVLSNLGFLFFNMLFLMYTSMTITILSFPLEMPVLVKEHFNRWYSLRAYYIAITLSDLPFQAIFCALYATIVYYLTDQPMESFRFGMFISACLLISFVAQSVGLVVGAAMNVQNGVFLAPVMSVPFLLFSGFFVSFDSIPVYLRWITYLSYIRYGFEGTAIATYGYNRSFLDCHQDYCHFKNPRSTLKELDMTQSEFQVDIIALIVIFFILRVAAYIFLKWKLMSVR